MTAAAIPWGQIISAAGQAGSAYLSSRGSKDGGGGSVVSGMPGTTVSTGAVSQSVSLNSGGDPGLYQSPSYSSRALPGYSAVGWPGGYDGYQDAEWSLEGSNWIPIAIAGVLVVGAIIAVKLVH